MELCVVMKGVCNLPRKFRDALKSSGFRATMHKSLRYLQRLVKRTRRVACAKSVTSYNLPTRQLGRPLHLLLDHDSGGGAYAFREQYVSRLLAQDADILVWQYFEGTGSYFFEWRTRDGFDTYRARSLEDAAAFIHSAAPDILFFNNMAGWPRIADTLDILLLQQAQGSILQVFLHDYFTVCPAYPLLNRQGQFCGIPSPSDICIHCLPGHPLAASCDNMNIYQWRHMWERFLTQADRVTAADKSVTLLLQQAYPQLAKHIHIEPHAPLCVWQPLPQPPADAPPVLGVIGHITRHKGAGIVEGIVHLLETKDIDLRVVIIGSLESSLCSPLLHVHGRYVQADLPMLLQKYGVTVCLVPSPLPETFCYVAQEIEMLGLPLVCLNLGAQGARAQRYAKGMVASTCDAEGCLDAILLMLQHSTPSV